MYELQLSGNVVTYIDNIENRRISVLAPSCMGLFTAKTPQTNTDENAYLDALQHPVSGQPLCKIALNKKAKTAAVIVSDITRKVPTSKIASHIVDELVAGGVPITGITFFVALGVHRDATTPEMQSFVGTDLYNKINIENHDAFNEEKLITLGTTPAGTPVSVNKKAYECDVKIVIGKVELHEMAGFSGGRKSILPGIASAKTILVNHRPEMIFASGTGAGKLAGNPIHEDMLEAARMFGVDFNVNFVVDGSEQPSRVFAGSLEESHLYATKYVEGFVEVVLPKKPDLFIITPGSPLNCDMYQGVKALIAMHHVLDEDTAVLLYGAFPEGVNSEDFVAPFLKFPDDLDKAKDYAWNNYSIQMDHTLPIIEIIKTGAKIIVCSENIPDELIKTLHMLPCRNLEKAIALAASLLNKKDPVVAFLPQPQRGLVSYK